MRRTQFLWVCMALLCVLGCSEIAPTNPFDPVTPSAQQASRRAFEAKMRRNDHADLAVMFAEREQASQGAKRRDQTIALAAPPISRKASAPAADMVRSHTEPKLVQR